MNQHLYDARTHIVIPIDLNNFVTGELQHAHDLMTKAGVATHGDGDAGPGTRLSLSQRVAELVGLLNDARNTVHTQEKPCAVCPNNGGSK